MGMIWWKETAPKRIVELREQLETQRPRIDVPPEKFNARVPPDKSNDERLARKAEKFSPGWDLCTGFVKTGKCKNKNCKWRHEMPMAKSMPEKVEPAPAEPKKATDGKKKSK